MTFETIDQSDETWHDQQNDKDKNDRPRDDRTLWRV